MWSLRFQDLSKSGKNLLFIRTPNVPQTSLETFLRRKFGEDFVRRYITFEMLPWYTISPISNLRSTPRKIVTDVA